MLTSNFVNKRNVFELKEIGEFLKSYGVDYDEPDHTIIIRDQGKIVGTGSVDGKVMKYFFIDENYKGQGILPKIYSPLLNYLLDKNITEHFIFTKPENEYIFTGIGLHKLMKTDRVLLLEGGFSSYESWIKSVKKLLNPDAKTRGAIVANCNPMTKGHKYLMEYASDKVDELLVFILEEDKSVFPTDTRYSIVKKEFESNPKIKVVKGGPYMISQATFPTYFIKKIDESLDIYTELDAKLFSQKIAVDLGIDIRFVGDEPIDELTAKYNENLVDSTKGQKVTIEKIDRIKYDGDYISASKVRAYLKEGKLAEAYLLLPDSTIDYLEGDQGKSLVAEIQKKER